MASDETAESEHLAEPVRRLPTDPPQDQIEAGMALCLSGGGYRAMLFHAGALWRLSEVGLLNKLERIFSVSGGSITAALLGLKWSRLDLSSRSLERSPAALQTARSASLRRLGCTRGRLV